ncbi:hypothetical protein JX266_011673 [Neoarthrinium moseri]|nr:hypothetical protein JX266_011673 [Neoarthrinium moseri]
MPGVPRLSGALAGCHLILRTLAQNTISLDVPGSPPSGASGYIDPSFAGFGIEPSNLFSFTGYDTPNELTFNLINNLANFTGKPPHIRLGGNTEDYMVFSQDQDRWTWVNNPNSVGQGAYASDHMLIGPRFFEAANRFPEGTPVTWGLNLAYEESDWEQQITTMARQVVENCPNLKLVSFEIGNEPDLYLQNSFRTAPWGGREYTEAWLARANAVYEQVLKPNNITAAFFEPACTASTIGTDFQIKDLVSFGIEANAANGDKPLIASWNQHDYYYYIGVSAYTLTLSHFLQLSTTEDQFSAWLTQLDQAGQTPYPYALREMGVVGPIGMHGVTDVFAAALWTLNFFLYAASLNISSVQLHMTDTSNASAWQPIPMYGRQPFVRPGYYGYAAFDQAIGPTCTAQVAPQVITGFPAGYDGFVRSYSVYQAGQWASIVVINAKQARSTDANIPSLTVQLSLPTGLAGQQVYLSYLTNAGSDASAGTTWNGLSFEQSGDGTPSPVDDGSGKTVQVGNDGTLSVEVRDSQAVVASLGRRVGTGYQVDEGACAVVAQSRPGVGTGSNGGHIYPTGGDGDGDNNNDKNGDGQEDAGTLVRSRLWGWGMVLSGLAVGVLAF